MTKLIYIFLTIAVASTLFAGGTIFGLSDKNLGIVIPTYSAPGLARSFETADDDSLHVNYQNYAMWSQLTYPTFEIDVSYRAGFSESRTNEKYFRDGANFQGGFLTIPINKKSLAIGFGMIPILDLEYSVQDTTNLGDNEFLLIKGGLSRATVNISYAPFKIFGIGLGYEYTFGKIVDRFRFEIQGSDANTIEFEYEHRFYGHGTVFSAFFKPFNGFNIGAQYRIPVNLGSDIVARSRADYVNKGLEKSFTLPALYNMGMKFNLGDRYSMGMDYIFQDWEKGYKINDVVAGTYQSVYQRIGGGFQRHASTKRFTSFLEKLDYRMGFFYTNQNQTSAGNNINEYGVSMGFSLPLYRFRSRIDFSGVVGHRGSLEKNSYEEMFFMFGVSISANEKWFVQMED